MNEQKQIEEMAVILTDGGCADCTECSYNDRFNCKPMYDAELLYEAGYRKQSEGEWVVCGMFDDFLKCSICGDKHPWQTAMEYKYCPNCGAKMKGGE